MRERDEQHQPHVRDGCFCVDKCLQRQSKNDRCPAAKLLPVEPHAPGEDHQRSERGRDRRWKTRREIVFTEDTIADGLGPLG